MKAESKSEKTRLFIVEKAAELINKKGYLGTSITDLTKATKLTSGSIYGNFENKDEVGLEAFDYNAKRLRNFINSRVNSCDSFQKKLLMHVQAYKRTSDDQFRSGGCPIQNTLLEADDTNEILRGKASTALLQWKKEVVTVIKQGIEAGEFKPGTNVEATATKILALVEFAFLIGSATQSMKQMNATLQIAEQVVAEITT